MSQQKIIIVGAGPKALNILAKNEALKKNGWKVPDITVIEKTDIGSNWTGANGYTDGEGLLAISPLKTFNYPSGSIYGKAVADYINQFSFTTYLSSVGDLEKWVDGGMGRITHKEFAAYLKWVGAHFKDQIIYGEVTKIKATTNKWLISYHTTTGDGQLSADGLVFTGPGEASNPFAIKPDGLTVFDGKNWWKQSEKSQFAGSADRIALIGGGISAGAIFESLMAITGEESHVDWYTRRGLMTRSENIVNNQRFSHPDLWQQIPPAARQQFAAATDRGSIDIGTHMVMSHHHENFNEVIGTISSVQHTVAGIQISFTDGLAQKTRLYNKVILATGFDNADFLKLMDNKSKNQLLKTDLLSQIEPDLSVRSFTPKLHLPMLSWLNIGIGCATLGSPSVMSDRILSAWVTQDRMLERSQAATVKAGGTKGDSLFAAKNIIAGEIVANGYPTRFSNQRTTTSVQIGIDLHMEPSYWFVKANHSCDPNCGLKANSQGGYSLVAIKAIQKGEEISWDYAMSEWESIALANNKCECKSSDCREKIGGYKKLSQGLKQKYAGFSAPYLAHFQ